MNSISIDAEIQGGVPCFSGTRVPVEGLFDHLAQGYTVDYFLTQFPRVTREQVDSVLQLAKKAVTVGSNAVVGK